ncbi:hypothetical protein BDV95DRAFT_247387 [Massariosphaeria phaeospora]|uniref:Uncharacterized protein n=1 Tax=Massariosphaeria phaeospora TaxID=100035 RepID=A0A7C8I366_9PLEO|nr:hypothetical protein BDV95DRAFT_247387 [Massariosphaeria phaeospora]
MLLPCPSLYPPMECLRKSPFPPSGALFPPLRLRIAPRLTASRPAAVQLPRLPRH